MIKLLYNPRVNKVFISYHIITRGVPVDLINNLKIISYFFFFIRHLIMACASFNWRQL